jgi:broad specificity phosphatase PhoE
MYMPRQTRRLDHNGLVRTIEHRRHTMRAKPGQHLTQAGVELARRVGEGMGRFDRVVTSRVPRAYESAIAMGYAVDEQLEALSSTPDGLVGEDAEVDLRQGWVAFQRAARVGGLVARYVLLQGELMRAIAAALPEGGRALVVSHGGIVEASAVGCRPDDDFAAWGPGCGYCEGVRLTFEGDRCVAAELLRVPGSVLES